MKFFRNIVTPPCFLSHPLLAFIIVFLTSFDCNATTKELRTIKVDIDNATDYIINPSAIITLDTSDLDRFHSIEQLVVTDSRFFIKSGDLLKIFNVTDGRCLGDLASKGNSAEEYLCVNRLWKNGDTILVFDSTSKKINSYNTSGEFLHSRSLFENAPKPSPSHPDVNFIIESPDTDGFYSINTWMGGIGDPVPTYSRYFADGSLRYLVKGRFLNDGTYGYSRAAIDRRHNRIITWESAIDTLFAISDSIVKPLYAFDYGIYSLPQYIQATPNMFMRFHAAKAENADCIVSAQYFTPIENKLIFSLLHYNMGNSGVLIATLDQDTLTTRVVRIFEPSGRYIPQVNIYLDPSYLYLALRDTWNDHPAIVPLPLSIFL